MPNVRARPLKGDRPDRPTRWQLVWSLPPDPATGKQRREYETFHGTKGAAQKRWREHQADIDANPDAFAVPQPKAPKGPEDTLAALISEWVETHLRQPGVPYKTAHVHAYLLYHYVEPRLGSRQFSEIAPSDITDLYATLLASGGKSGRPLSPRTVRLTHSLLRQVFQMAVDDDRLTSNPTTKARVPKQGPKAPPKWFTPEEMWRLVDAARKHRLAAWWPVLWATGARPEELLGLRWQDVDFGQRTIRFLWAVKETSGHIEIGQLKTPKSRRTLAFPAAEPGGLDVFAVLADHRTRQDGEKHEASAQYRDYGWVFCTQLGNPLNLSNVRRLWRGMCKKAKVPPYPPYSVRHTCASHMLQAGVPLHEVSEWLGHGGIGITKDVYGHLSSETVRKAAGTMAHFVRRVGGASDG